MIPVVQNSQQRFQEATILFDTKAGYYGGSARPINVRLYTSGKLIAIDYEEGFRTLHLGDGGRLLPCFDATKMAGNSNFPICCLFFYRKKEAVKRKIYSFRTSDNKYYIL